MEKNLYIDASHPEETRVVLKSKSHIEEYEYENKNSLNQKSNIYLGKISRVEPSLQAAFVNYGRERHGFLAFNDIQSDYYQIPQNDLEKIKQEEEKADQKRKLQTKKTPTDVEIFGPDVIDELEGVLEEIRASVDVYPGRQPGETGDVFQHLRELKPFHSEKPQEVSLEKYPKLQKLFKSFIHQMVLEGRGKQPYEPSHLTLFSQGMTDFYKENKELATEGVFDVNLISELGFGRSANQIKEFLKSKGVVGQRKFSRDLREVFHYFT